MEFNFSSIFFGHTSGHIFGYGVIFSRTKHACLNIVTALLILLLIPEVLYAFVSRATTQSASSERSNSPNNLPTNNDAKNITKESIFKRSSNRIYRFMDDHEYLFAPISGAAAGMIRCGFLCAAAGGAVGSIDEALVYFGYTDRRYLTWGIFGMTTVHVINPSLVSDAAGVVVGVLAPTGILNDHQELIAPALSLLAGNSIAGISKASGMIGSGTAGILDEILLNSELTDKHYLTFCSLGSAAVNLLGLGFSPAIANSIGVVLGLVAANYEEEISNNLLAPINTGKSLYRTYNKFIPKELLDDHIEKHALTLVGSQFLTQFLSLKIMGYQQNLVYNFERLDNSNGPAWNNIGREATNFAIFLFPYVIGQTFSNNVDRYFDKKLHTALEDQIKAKLFSGEVALHLSHDKNSTVLMDNLKDDISTVVNSGSSLVTGAISTSVGGAYGVGIIIVHSPNMFVYSALYNKAQNFVANYLTNGRRAYAEEVKMLNSKLVTTAKHNAENIRTITERDGIKAIREESEQISSDLRELEGIQRQWSMANSLWWTVSGTVDSMFNYYLLGREITQGRIPFEDRNKVQIANWQTSSLLSWAGHQAQTISEIEQSLDRIIILEGKMHLSSNDIDNVDQIKREIKTGNQLILKNLEVGVEDRVLVEIEELKLDMGKTYAITGKTGSGKTSLLSKIKGIERNRVSGKGYIYYPERSIDGVNEEVKMEERGGTEKTLVEIKAEVEERVKRRIKERALKIVMLSQQDYFPLDSSLYDIILFPDKISNDLVLNNKKREKIGLLLKEIGLNAFASKNSGIYIDTDTCINSDVNDANVGVCSIDQDEKENKNEDENENNDSGLSLDSKKDWYTYLSGGEKKKIMLISAIIKNPDILILDEIFNGLDKQSIVVAQQMLKKYLSKTLILSVDHHAQDNNNDGFYDNELHLSDKKIVVQEMCD